MKKIIKMANKIVTFLLLLFLLFFNLNLIVDNNGWSVNLVKDIVAKEAVPPEGGGGGGSYTHFANYGTYTKTVYCQKVTVGQNGIQITYYFATVYWLKEVCVSGGQYQECTYGTVRSTYLGGGC